MVSSSLNHSPTGRFFFFFFFYAIKKVKTAAVEPLGSQCCSTGASRQDVIGPFKKSKIKYRMKERNFLEIADLRRDGGKLPGC